MCVYKIAQYDRNGYITENECWNELTRKVHQEVLGNQYNKNDRVIRICLLFVRNFCDFNSGQ